MNVRVGWVTCDTRAQPACPFTLGGPQRALPNWNIEFARDAHGWYRAPQIPIARKHGSVILYLML